MPKKRRQAKKKYRAQVKRAQLTAKGYSESLKSAPAVSKPLLSSTQAPSPPLAAARYQYVLPELRRIVIIAGAMFLILIVLAFVLS